jgi:hypothetical protein
MKTEGYTLPPAGVTAFRPYARGRAKKYLQKRVWLRIAGYCQSLTPCQVTLIRRKAGFLAAHRQPGFIGWRTSL